MFAELRTDAKVPREAEKALKSDNRHGNHRLTGFYPYPARWEPS